jgi:hypothetical protein
VAVLGHGRTTSLCIGDVGGCGDGGWAVATLSVKAGAGSWGLCASRGQPPAVVGRPPAEVGARALGTGWGGAVRRQQGWGSRRSGRVAEARVLGADRGQVVEARAPGAGRGRAWASGVRHRRGQAGWGHRAWVRPREGESERERGREKGNLVILSILKAHVSATSAHNSATSAHN